MKSILPFSYKEKKHLGIKYKQELDDITEQPVHHHQSSYDHLTEASVVGLNYQTKSDLQEEFYNEDMVSVLPITSIENVFGYIGTILLTNYICELNFQEFKRLQDCPMAHHKPRTLDTSEIILFRHGNNIH